MVDAAMVLPPQAPVDLTAMDPISARNRSHRSVMVGAMECRGTGVSSRWASCGAEKRVPSKVCAMSRRVQTSRLGERERAEGGGRRLEGGQHETMGGGGWRN